MIKGKINVLCLLFIVMLSFVSAETYIPALFNIGNCPSEYDWQGQPEAVGNTGQLSIVDYNGDEGFGRQLVNFCSKNNQALLMITNDLCGSKETTCPVGYTSQGKIKPGNDCDLDFVGYDSRGIKLDAGWFTLCSKDDSVILSERSDDCSPHETWYCPSGYSNKGKIHMGSGALCNEVTGIDYKGRAMRAGWMNLCVKEVEAECTEDDDCSDTECDQLDGCVGKDYYDFSDVINDCVDYSCESNVCGSPDISYNDLRCVEGIHNIGFVENYD